MSFGKKAILTRVACLYSSSLFSCARALEKFGEAVQWIMPLQEILVVYARKRARTNR